MLSEADVLAAPIINNRYGLLNHALDRCHFQGHTMEFGVASGLSINHIAEQIAPEIVFGFDSFEGLPEDWDQGSHVVGRAHFAGPPPRVPDNAVLVIGWFQETLEPWLADHRGPVAFLHIDSDIYSSAAYVLEQLNERIALGTVIVFDELMEFREPSPTVPLYTTWREHEWRALLEWLARDKRTVRPLARDDQYRVAFQVTR